ncbi:hypothetical protein RhiJN_02286 [Ceratobasidium sp. AG-Ba]|nr:hypothetical protein RhiJN_02286 [Ceratobasidium sp. AG-Ba]
MAPQPPPPPSSEPVSSSSKTRSRSSRTSSQATQTTTELPLTQEINTTSLHVDPSYTVSAPALAATQSSTDDGTQSSTTDGTSNSSPSRALTVSIVIIVIVVAALLALTALFVRLYRRRRQQNIPRTRSRPNVLRRPESRKRSRRPSDFWSADVSKPPSAHGISPKSPNEHAGLLGQEQAMRELMGGQRGSTMVAGSSQMRVPSPISLQLPTPTLQVWDRNTDVEQQMAPSDDQGPVQPRISESEQYFYPYEPSQHSARNSTSTVHSRSLLSPITANEPAYSSSNLEHETGPTSSPHVTSSSLSSRHQSAEPFPLDNLVLGSAASLSRAQSPTQPSARSSIEPGPSLSYFPLPPTRQHTLQSPESVLQIPPPEPQPVQPPEPALQPDISQTLTSLRRSPSRTTYLQRNTSSASTVASRRPRLDIVTDVMRHPPTSFSAGYFMYASPENERPRLPRVVSEAMSVESVYSTPDELAPVPSRHDSGSSGREAEGEMDGVRYSREERSSSPALPDSVRTSVLSFFETRR